MLLATLVVAAAPKKRTFKVEVRVFLIEDGQERYVGTSGMQFSPDHGNPQMHVHANEGNSVTFGGKVRTKFSLREVMESP